MQNGRSSFSCDFVLAFFCGVSLGPLSRAAEVVWPRWQHREAHGYAAALAVLDL